MWYLIVKSSAISAVVAVIARADLYGWGRARMTGYDMFSEYTKHIGILMTSYKLDALKLSFAWLYDLGVNI